MTDDPSAAFVTPERTRPAMTTPTDPLTSEAVRTALVDLLTIGQHHHAGTPATLTAVGDTRRSLAHRLTLDDQRLTALNDALSAVSEALLVVPPPRRPDTAALRDGLTELAAVALGWLDTLPGRPQPNPDTEPL